MILYPVSVFSRPGCNRGQAEGLEKHTKHVFRRGPHHMYTRWAPLLVINVVTTPINGIKKLVSLGLFHPYKWSYFTLLSGFLDPTRRGILPKNIPNICRSDDVGPSAGCSNQRPPAAFWMRVLGVATTKKKHGNQFLKAMKNLLFIQLHDMKNHKEICILPI